jgi:hypothetical protein
MRLPRSKSGLILGFVYLGITVVLISCAGSEVGGAFAIAFTLPWSAIAAYFIIKFESTWPDSMASFVGTLFLGATINTVLLYYIGSLLEKAFKKLKNR